MERQKAYALIKKYDLATEVKNRFGDNYTRVATHKLAQVIWDYDASLCDEDPYGEDVPTPTTEAPKKAPQVTNTTDAYEAACLAFIAVLKDSGKLDSLLAKL